MELITWFINVVLHLDKHLTELIDGPAIGGLPGPPLRSVDRPEISLGVGPLIPDGDTVLLEISRVGVTPDEPQQLMDDRLQMHFLVVNSGKPAARSKRSCAPKMLSVPVPVRSVLRAPFSSTCFIRSR